MAIKIEMLRCFAAVAKHGSLAEASIVLGRTPSAVSMMLKQFEDHIGAPLFETARKSHLTSLGAMIYERAKSEVTHFENTVSVIEGLARSEEGYLRLAVAPSVATAILPSVLMAFSTAHPHVQIDLREMNSASIISELRNEGVDVGIGTLGVQDGMDRTALFSDAFGVVCRKDHQLARDWDSLTWRDMHDHTLIANGLCAQIADPDFAPVLERSRMMVHNTSSLLGLVQEGAGITVLPKLAALALPDTLCFLPLADLRERRHVHMVSQPAHLLMPAVKSFVKLMKLKAVSGFSDTSAN